MAKIKSEQDWIELLHNLEVNLLTACNQYDFLNPLNPENSKRIRLYTRIINNQICMISLDYEALQWVGCMCSGMTITNPESVWLEERKNEKSHSS